MKTLSANALAEIVKNLGTEPLTIIGVEWTENGSVAYYATKSVANIPGTITEIGSVDALISSKTGSNASVDVTLADVNGSIKAILDKTDAHKRPCTIYQYFGDLDLADKFTIFRGQISTPFTWSEGSRAISFTILSEIEDQEVGFSPEEGQFNFVSRDAVGKPWPLAFGHVVHSPAAKVKQVVVGQLKNLFGLIDPLLYYKRDSLYMAYRHMLIVYQYFGAVAQSIDAICPPVNVILDLYCQIIKIYNQAAFQFQQHHMQMLKAQKLRDAQKNGREPGEPQAQDRGDVLIRNQLANQLVMIQNQKELIEHQIELALYKMEVQQEAFGRQRDAFGHMLSIYAQYIKINNEICRQTKTVLNSVEIEGGRYFPQGQTVTLSIKGVHYRGTFNGDTFSNIVGPVAKYKNVPLGPRQPILDDCGVKDTDEQAQTFWVNNPNYQLKDCYALVRSRHTGQNHVVKIIEQEGTKCTIQLVAIGGETYGPQLLDGSQGGNLIRSKVPLPHFGWTPIGQTPYTGDFAAGTTLFPDIVRQRLGVLSPDIVQCLQGTPISQDEFNNFLKLDNVRHKDYAANFVIFHVPTPRDVYTIIGEDISQILEVSAVPLRSWLNKVNWEELPDSFHWEAPPGTEVHNADDVCEIYVANILPSNIKSVMAHRINDDGERVLTPIPKHYYRKNEALNIGDLTITTLTFPTPLSFISGEGWEDTVYVTLNSSVGPNVSDILRHLVTTYTNKNVDNTSFNSVRDKFRDGSGQELYPANFTLTTRRNVLEEMSSIAWQARCSIYELNGVVYLKYLAEEPIANHTITEDDIEQSTLQLNFTETENLVTKFTATWRPDYLDTTEEQKVVIRNNIKKYGLQERERDFYIYNIESLVTKSATFWMIRLSNTWKRVSFTTFLHKIELDANDAILLDLQTPYISNNPIKCVIERAVYDPTEKKYDIEAWVPIRSGEMEKYPFAWPANAPPDAQYPTHIDTNVGFRINVPIDGC